MCLILRNFAVAVPAIDVTRMRNCSREEKLVPVDKNSHESKPTHGNAYKKDISTGISMVTVVFMGL